MSARKKAKKAEPAASNENDSPAAQVEEIATQTGANVYRVDLGESLPPQKHPGVE